MAISAAEASTAQTVAAPPPALITPNTVETPLGTLEFKDGAPSPQTASRIYDNLDFTHAFDAFVNTFQGVSTKAIHKAFLDIGVQDNEIVVFSNLMDANSLFLTANTDTVYFCGVLDVSKGPMVFEAPPDALGIIDDMWWRWVTDFGRPGPDRGLGGKYLILPPAYDGPVPEGGYFVARSGTNHALILGRAFLEDNDPKPAADRIRATAKIYPYQQGGAGTSIAQFLSGNAKLGSVSKPPAMVFHEGSGVKMNTVPPNDWTFYELLNELVQEEPLPRSMPSSWVLWPPSASSKANHLLRTTE